MKRKTLADRLDDLVNNSGLYALARPRRPEPRNLRVMPIAILVALVVGYGMTFIGFGKARFALGFIGAVLFFGAFVAANWARFAGPRIVPDHETALDERELMLKAKVGSATGTILTMLTVFGCFYLGFAQFLGWWMPHRINEWIYLGLLIEGWWFTLPVLLASWLQPPDTDED